MYYSKFCLNYEKKIFCCRYNYLVVIMNNSHEMDGNLANSSNFDLLNMFLSKINLSWNRFIN